MPYFYPGISKSSTHISDFSLLNVTEMEAEAWRNEINVSKFMLWVRTRARNRLALNIPEMMKGQDKTQDSLVRWSCLFPLTRARIHCAQSKADEMGALTSPAQFLSALVSHFPIYVCVFLLVRRCLAAPIFRWYLWTTVTCNLPRAVIWVKEGNASTGWCTLFFLQRFISWLSRLHKRVTAWCNLC